MEIVGHSGKLHAPFSRFKPPSLIEAIGAAYNIGAMLQRLGIRIRERMAALDLDQSELAAAASMSAQRLNNYIQARRTPDLPSIVKLASALQTTTDWLLGAEDHRTETGLAVLRELLSAADVPSEQIDVILSAQTEALRLLAVLPDEGDVPLRSRMAARAAWHSRSAPKPH